MLHVYSWQTKSDDKSFSSRLLRRLEASGLPRAVSTMLKGDFAIFTSSRGEYGPQDNAARMSQLKRELRNLGYGFVDTRGTWKEEDINTKVRAWMSEDSIFVPGITEEWARTLSAQFGQESYLWGSNDSYVIKSVKDGMVWQQGSVQEDFRLVSEEKPSDVYTELGSDRRPFVFDPARRKQQGTVTASSDQWMFFSFAGNPHSIGRRYGICEMSDVPDAGALDCWLPLWRG